MSINPTEPAPIAVAVVRHADKVLIGKRPSGVPLAGLWEFPGGKVIEGETPPGAAARECLEETDVAVQVAELCLEVIHCYPHGRVKLQFFAASPVDPAQEPRRPFRWVRVSDLPKYSFPPANAAMIAKLVEEKSKARD